MLLSPSLADKHEAPQAGQTPQINASYSQSRSADSQKDEPPEPEQAELTPEEEQRLAEAGVEGDITVQEDQAGGRMYLDEDGDWLAEFPEINTPQAPNPESPQHPQAAWSAGVCTGSFYHPWKNGSFLEWGAQDACVTTRPNAVYPHYIRVTLRDTCAGPFCASVENLWTVTSNNSRYSSVATVSESSHCKSSETRTYSLVVYVTVRGVQYGPFASRGQAVEGCHVHPAPGGV